MEAVAVEKIEEVDARLRRAKASSIPLEERLEKLPGLLYAKELEIYELSEALAAIKDQLETIEREEYLRIDGETIRDSNGKVKKKFSNEAARQAELQRRLRDSEKYQRLKVREKATHDRLENLKIEHSFLARLYSSTKYLARLRVATAEEVEG